MIKRPVDLQVSMVGKGKSNCGNLNLTNVKKLELSEWKYRTG